MSEAKKEDAPKKKKGGKLPIIIVLVLALAGGGFFMMKGKGGEEKGKKKKKVEVAVKAGETAQIGEYLVNLRESGTYLRTEISAVVAEGIDTKHGFDTDALSDAIIGVLSGKSMSEISSPEGKKALKAELAYEMSKVLAEGLAHHGKEWPKVKMNKPHDAKDAGGHGHGDADHKTDAPKKKKKADADEESSDEEEPAAEEEEEVHHDYDCNTGPILKVLFRSFTTQ